MKFAVRSALRSLVIVCVVACGDDQLSRGDAGLASRVPMTLEQAKDPAQCKNCHPNHYTEWASSMHAYASKDPVFVAMNARGQRETNGALGDFCLKCHAPMAVMDGKIANAADSLTDLPAAYQGITCYTCHNTVSVEGDHNAVLHLGNDVTMRGPIHDPKQPIVHKAAYSATLDDVQKASNQMCGGCHDIVSPNTPDGVHLERTFEEYKTTVFAKPGGGQTCAACHMKENIAEPAAVDPPSNVGTRPTHEHLWEGVDVALTDDFPNQEVQRLAVQCMLASSVVAFLRPNESIQGQATHNVITAELDTSAGHRQPSGASQDRRMWFEWNVYDANDELLTQSSSGLIADGELEEKPIDDPAHDSQLWMFHDRIFDAQGQPTHNFWDAAPSMMFPMGYKDPDDPVATLPAQVDINKPHGAMHAYRLPLTSTGPGQAARVDGRLRIRPIGMDVLQDLVASGDLDPAIPARMPTFTFLDIAWTVTDPAPADPIMQAQAPDSLHCPESYMCPLRPGSMYCDKLDAEQ